MAIWGLGPIGLSAARWCQLKGAKRVIAIDGVKARMDYAREKLGIETIDFNEYKNVPKRILELVPGGLDRALDCGQSVFALKTSSRLMLSTVQEHSTSQRPCCTRRRSYSCLRLMFLRVSV